MDQACDIGMWSKHSNHGAVFSHGEEITIWYDMSDMIKDYPFAIQNHFSEFIKIWDEMEPEELANETEGQEIS